MNNLAGAIANLPPEHMAGCKWCETTIFWNGSFWTHANRDVRKCERPWQHNFTRIGSEMVVVRHTIFKQRPVEAEAPVWECLDCGCVETASLSYGEWVPKTYGCPAKVATPVIARKPEPETESDRCNWPRCGREVMPGSPQGGQRCSAHWNMVDASQTEGQGES